MAWFIPHHTQFISCRPTGSAILAYFPRLLRQFMGSGAGITASFAGLVAIMWNCRCRICHSGVMMEFRVLAAAVDEGTLHHCSLFVLALWVVSRFSVREEDRFVISRDSDDRTRSPQSDSLSYFGLPGRCCPTSLYCMQRRLCMMLIAFSWRDLTVGTSLIAPSLPFVRLR